MSSYLVERLRVRADRMPTIDCELLHDAADRIEELETKLDRALELAHDECHFQYGSGAYNDWRLDHESALEEIAPAKRK